RRRGGLRGTTGTAQRVAYGGGAAAEGTLRGELCSLGGEVFRDPIGEHPRRHTGRRRAHGRRALGRRCRDLVFRQPGAEHSGALAQSVLLAAPGTAHRHGPRLCRRDQDRDQYSRSDRLAGPQEHRNHALGTAGDTRASGRSAPPGRPRVAKRVNRLRNRLVLIFLAATLAPLAATIWITTSLLEESIDTSSTARLDTLSKSLTGTAREFYGRASEDLKRRAQAGAIQPRKYDPLDRASWPEAIKIFSGGLDGERVVRAGQDGNRLDYLVRHGNEIWSYSENLGDVAMDRLTREIRDARRAVEEANARDLRRGVKRTYVLLAASIWLVSLGMLVFLAHRISRPIQELTTGLGKLAGGDLNARVQARRDDEIGRAIGAFNHMAGALQESTERLVYLRQLASWQTLARKMAHEVKNSLTPIRLTVEEMLVRYDEADRGFMEQATQIVVDEIETLERRIRAFSQFATEPPVQPGVVDVNGLLQERIAFLKTAHPEVAYDCRLEASAPPVVADQDLLKGILTNLL